MIKSVLNIGYPRELVYRILCDYTAYKDWLPGCRRSVILASEGNRSDVETTVEGMKTITMEMRFEAEPATSLRFVMTKSKDLKAYHGEYRLMDAANDKGTVIISEIEMDAGAMVPRFMLDRMLRKILDDMCQALNERVKAFSAQAVNTSAKPVEGRKRRRRILQIANTPSGPRIWYLGKVYSVKD